MREQFRKIHCSTQKNEEGESRQTRAAKRKQRTDTSLAGKFSYRRLTPGRADSYKEEKEKHERTHVL